MLFLAKLFKTIHIFTCIIIIITKHQNRVMLCYPRCPGNVTFLIQLVLIVIIYCDFCMIIGQIRVYVSVLNIYIKLFSYNQFMFSNVVANGDVIIFLSWKKINFLLVHFFIFVHFTKYIIWIFFILCNTLVLELME